MPQTGIEPTPLLFRRDAAPTTVVAGRHKILVYTSRVLLSGFLLGTTLTIS